jgi:tRNA(Ile2)-agmatinylcytidine synthase
VDDTDSPSGGCTTWVLTELLRVARDRGVDLIGDPRLVRLNPNIPWKTRGNAALSARFGRGQGPRRRVGEVDGRPLWGYARGRPLGTAERAEFVEAAWARVLAVSRRSDAGTDPALVATSGRLPSSLYWEAVREVVPTERVRRLLTKLGADVRTSGSERGIVGAAASIAWPGRRHTWELIAYRTPDRLGAPRTVDGASVRAAQSHHPALFLCYDRRTRRVLVAPHTRCPILYGLRSVDRVSPLRARTEISSEPVDRWALFRTNQGTGDHLRPRSVADLEPYGSAVLEGTVDGTPVVSPGGHVRFTLRDSRDGVATCLAFEPTKTLPRVARSLERGDRIRVWGGRSDDRAFRLEGIRLLRLVPRYGRLEAPTCPACTVRGRSMGTGRGYRCPECRRRFPPEAARRTELPARYGPGEYHPTASARRHLHPRAAEV